MTPMELIERMLDFCHSDKARPCFVGWPRTITRSYLLFHVEHSSLAYVQDKHGNVSAIVIFIRCDEDELNRHWVVSHKDGKFLWIENAVSTNLRSLVACGLKIAKVHPDFADLKFYMRRRKRQCIYDSSRMLRLVRGLERKHAAIS